MTSQAADIYAGTDGVVWDDNMHPPICSMSLELVTSTAMMTAGAAFLAAGTLSLVGASTISALPMIVAIAGGLLFVGGLYCLIHYLLKPDHALPIEVTKEDPEATLFSSDPQTELTGNLVIDSERAHTKKSDMPDNTASFSTRCPILYGVYQNMPSLLSFSLFRKISAQPPAPVEMQPINDAREYSGF